MPILSEPALEQLPVYACQRVPGPLTVDGNLERPVWQALPVLRLALADGSGQPCQETVVRGCWDGDYLYLAFDCQDVDIRANFTQRDDKVWQEEAVEAFIAPYGDLLHYYEFQCSPRNVVRDVRVTNPNAHGEAVVFDGEWNCAGWRTAVSLHGRLNVPGSPGQGWQAEWAIPLAALLPQGAGPVLAGEEWRLNLFRIDRWPLEEWSAWAPVPVQPLSFHRPQFFGRWRFEG